MSTGISWTDEVWNPVTGCSKVSAGCANCYAAALAPRLAAMGQRGYTDLPWTAKNAAENVHLHPDRLEKPLYWKKPRRVFVSSMSDLFHEQVPDEFIDCVFAVMALTPQHTFQILTKRPRRMVEWFNRSRKRTVLAECLAALYVNDPDIAGHTPFTPEAAMAVSDRGWPLSNVWLGVSVEDQRAADERIPHLLRCPAAVRFLSCEPLLGPVDLRRWMYHAPVLRGSRTCEACGEVEYGGSHDRAKHLPGPRSSLTWVIAGGESGPGFRPMDHAWAKALRDQCVSAGVAFFFKQSSSFRNETDPFLDGEMWRQFPIAGGNA